MQPSVPAGICTVPKQTKLIQLPDLLDRYGVFIPIHYGLLNFCKKAYPFRANRFYLNEIRSVLWDRESPLWDEDAFQELESLRKDIEILAGASENLLSRSHSEIILASQDIHIVGFPPSDHIYGDFVPIYSGLNDACKTCYGRESNRFSLAEIQLVLLTDIRFNTLWALTEGIFGYFVDLLDHNGLSNSPRGNFVWLVNRVKGFVCIYIHEGRWVLPNQGNPDMALVKDLKPLTTSHEGPLLWKMTLQLSCWSVIECMDILSNLIRDLSLAQSVYQQNSIDNMPSV